MKKQVVYQSKNKIQTNNDKLLKQFKNIKKVKFKYGSESGPFSLAISNIAE